MPRQRKPQNWGARIWTGRVANTTTGSTTQQFVYRIPTGRNNECDILSYEVVGTSPINVVIEWSNVYRISLDTEALKNIIESYPDLDLSNVEVTLWEVEGDVTFKGNVTVEWEFTGTKITADEWNITSLSSTDITTNTLEAETVTATTTNTDTLTTTGDANVGGALNVAGNTALAGSLEVTGESTFNNNVAVNGDASITGETNTETLSVNDFATIPTLTSTEITTDKLKVNDGAEVVGGLEVSDGLMVEWNTTLENLLVQDDATFEKDVNVEGTTNLKETNTENLNVNGNSVVNGNSTVSGDATIAGNATVSQDLLVAGNSTTTGNSLVTGNSVVNGDSTVNGDTSINWETNLNGKVKANDDVSIDGNLEVKDDVVVDWTTTLKGAVEMKDDVEINGSTKINGSLSVDEDVNIAGNTKTKTLRAEEAVFDEVRINRSLDLGDDGVAPDFVLQKEKGQPNGVAPLDVNGKIPQEYLPDVYTTAIVKMGTGIFDNSDTAIIVDEAITPYSYVNISNYSDIHWDLDEIINEWQLTVVSNQVETGSFKYIVVNPIS